MTTIKDAWNDAQTPWGKAAVALFYSFAGLLIVTSIGSLIDPLSQGSECLMEWAGMHNHAAQATYKALVRNYNLFIIGFMLYASMAGVTIHNTTRVLLFWTVNNSFWMPVYAVADTCPSANVELYGTSIWMGSAWLCTILETKLRDRGSAQERESLNV